MNELANIEQGKTMSSREIAELTGKQHKDVMRDIRNMCEQMEIDSAQFCAQYKDPTGRALPCFNLDRYHTEVLVTGYDVKRRAAVIKRWHDLETGTALPVLKDPQLAAIMTTLMQLDTIKQAQEQQQKELAEVKAKIESSPQDYYTVAGYASLRGLSIDVKKANLIGRKASQLSKEYGFDIGKAHSAIFGNVNTYHVDVLCEVFA
jgi:phage regulator Rha-like protein